MRFYKSILVTCTTFTLTALVIVTGPLLGPEAEAQRYLRDMFPVQTLREIGGRFMHESTVIKYLATKVSDREVLAQLSFTGPDPQAVIQLRLDALAKFSEGGRKKVVILDGHGGALSKDQKEALVALGLRLEQSMRPYEQELPPKDDLLVRSVLLWGEAPVGMPIRRREIRP